jgi:hypothetical protein
VSLLIFKWAELMGVVVFAASLVCDLIFWYRACADVAVSIISFFPKGYIIVIISSIISIRPRSVRIACIDMSLLYRMPLVDTLVPEILDTSVVWCLVSSASACPTVIQTPYRITCIITTNQAN